MTIMIEKVNLTVKFNLTTLWVAIIIIKALAIVMVMAEWIITIT